MIFVEDLQEWFCSEDCRMEVIDPYGYLARANKDKQDMSSAILGICTEIDRALRSGDINELYEIKAMLATACEMYLKRS